MAGRCYVSISDQIKGQSRDGHVASSRAQNAALGPSSANCAFVRSNSITSSRMKSTRLHLRRDLPVWIVALAAQQRPAISVAERPLLAGVVLVV
jgi:hypothetical protein